MSQSPERDLRATIVDEATRSFATCGFAGTTMRDVAEACGCTKPALYYHFSSKETLFRAVVEHHLQRIDELMHRTIEGTGPIRPRLHAGVDGMIDYCMRQPLVMRLIQRMEASPEENAPVITACASREKHLHMLAGFLAEGVRSGELAAAFDPLDGALLLGGVIHLQLQRSVASGDWDRERIHRTVDLAFDGLLPCQK